MIKEQKEQESLTDYTHIYGFIPQKSVQWVQTSKGRKNDDKRAKGNRKVKNRTPTSCDKIDFAHHNPSHAIPGKQFAPVGKPLNPKKLINNAYQANYSFFNFFLRGSSQLLLFHHMIEFVIARP